MYKSNFSYKKSVKDEVLVFSFKGEMDKIGLHESKHEINNEINQFQGKTIVFDFEDLIYINSEAIGYLMQINGYLNSVDKKFVLVAVKKNVKDVLEAIGISEIIPVYESLNSFLKR